MKNNSGMSLLEILVVVGVFAILGIIVTQSVILTIRGSKKSESQIRVRENIDYALSVVGRQLRNANVVSPCPNVDPATVTYQDSEGISSTFSCVGIGGDDAFVASGSARLTGTEVVITSCTFTCEAGASNNPPSVTISLEGRDAATTGIEGSQVTSSTKVYLRTY